MAKKDDTTTSGGDTQTVTTTGQEATTTVQTPDYEKRFKDFESTISGQGETIKELQEAVVAASIISNTIANDPTLKANFEQTLKRTYGVQDNQQNQTGNQNQNPPANQNQTTPVTQIEKDVKEVKDADRNKTIADFEREAGILNLPEDQRKVARQKVEGYLNSFGWSVASLPLTSLRESLDKAFVGTIGIERAREEGKVEALTSYRANEKGVMGSFAGANIQSQEEETLSPEQVKWMQKLRVDKEKAEKTYQERDNEKDKEKVVK